MISTEQQLHQAQYQFDPDTIEANVGDIIREIVTAWACLMT